MTDTERFNSRVEQLEAQLRAKLGVRGRNLEARLRRAGRRLPKRLHQAGKVITEAQSKMAHPKLARLTDAEQVDRAFSHLGAYLDTIDRADRLKGALLGILGGLVFNLILLMVAVYGLLRWQGII
ncbi:hypothetical protein PEL8287_01928 [Roseovarius litorisediminis]|uniref:Uncharacterized protein n=1 Tax=Roseovarius litorisediminis TaxID=1312363 RepID=A0A1Y5SGP2_9RHOB|nr:hypothetical protein [Roseovarius litorisediminis]SLN39216.1 hypothetical protein PEL8287_01928 [Roseovarius litorisediminis]